MFIRVTIDKYYRTNPKTNEDDWVKQEQGPDRRININDIHSYWGEGSFTVMILHKQQYSPAVIALKENVEIVDAMVAAVNPAAAKILFGKKDE